MRLPATNGIYASPCGSRSTRAVDNSIKYEYNLQFSLNLHFSNNGDILDCKATIMNYSLFVLERKFQNRHFWLDATATDCNNFLFISCQHFSDKDTLNYLVIMVSYEKSNLVTGWKYTSTWWKKIFIVKLTIKNCLLPFENSVDNKYRQEDQLWKCNQHI